MVKVSTFFVIVIQLEEAYLSFLANGPPHLKLKVNFLTFFLVYIVFKDEFFAGKNYFVDFSNMWQVK